MMSPRRTFALIAAYVAGNAVCAAAAVVLLAP